MAAILANPKYTGHMVYGRTRNGHKPRPVPQAQWIWTPEPVHPAIIDRDTWEKAQHIGAVEAPADPSDPAAQAYRARIRERYAERYA